jgi:hypothetical protein
MSFYLVGNDAELIEIHYRPMVTIWYLLHVFEGYYDAYSQIRKHRTHLQLIWYSNELSSHTWIWGGRWIWEGRWHGRCCQKKRRVTYVSDGFISLEVELLGILSILAIPPLDVLFWLLPDSWISWDVNHLIPRFTWLGSSESSPDSPSYATCPLRFMYDWIVHYCTILIVNEFYAF